MDIVQDDEKDSKIGERPGQLTTAPAPLDDASANDAVNIEGGIEPSSDQLQVDEEDAFTLFAEGDEHFGPPPKERKEGTESGSEGK